MHAGDYLSNSGISNRHSIHNVCLIFSFVLGNTNYILQTTVSSRNSAIIEHILGHR